MKWLRFPSTLILTLLLIEFLDELPKTNVGKVLKKDLRAQEMEK